MRECKYCHEKDENKLTMSTRVVNGKVETTDVCLACFWIEKSRAEGKDGNKLSEQASERADEREIFKRFKFPSSSVGERIC